MLVEINPNQPEIYMQIDAEDYDLWMKYTWCFDGRYVKRKVNGKRNGPNKPRDPAKTFYFHREILTLPEGMHVDHIDGDKLNNQKSNLRICTQADNNKNISHAVGCTYVASRNKWVANIMHEGKRHYIGMYETFDEAHEAYLSKAIELRKDFASRIGGD